MVGSRALLDAITGDGMPWPDVRRLVLDLGGVTFLDAGGVGVLVRTRGLCAQRDVQLMLAAVPARVRKLLTLTGLLAAFGLDGQPAE